MSNNIEDKHRPDDNLYLYAFLLCTTFLMFIGSAIMFLIKFDLNSVVLFLSLGVINILLCIIGKRYCN